MRSVDNREQLKMKRIDENITEYQKKWLQLRKGGKQHGTQNHNKL
jgi:hypothetical protein